MSYESERKSVETHFLEQWNEAFETGYTFNNITFPSLRTAFDSDPANQIPSGITPVSRVAFDNVRFSPPDKNYANPEFSTWVRLTINPATTSQFTLGSNPIIRHNGVITVQVFQPEHSKRNVSRVFADAVSGIFNLQTLSIDDGILQCRESTLSRVGSVNEWYQLNVDTVYLREAGGIDDPTATGILRYGIVDTDLNDYIEFGTANVTSALHNDISFPVTSSTHRHWWFEYPSEFAFGAVYNIVLDRSLGTYDWRWMPRNPPPEGMPDGFDHDRVVFVSTEAFPIGSAYQARIHHLFELA